MSDGFAMELCGNQPHGKSFLKVLRPSIWNRLVRELSRVDSRLVSNRGWFGHLQVQQILPCIRVENFSSKLRIRTSLNKSLSNTCLNGRVRDAMTIISDEQIAYISDGGVIAYPTSTLPGLGCIPTKEGLDALFALNRVLQTSPFHSALYPCNKSKRWLISMHE